MPFLHVGDGRTQVIRRNSFSGWFAFTFMTPVDRHKRASQGIALWPELKSANGPSARTGHPLKTRGCEVFEGSLLSLDQTSNPLRLNNFATNIRELSRIMLHRLASDQQVRACTWYVPVQGKSDITRRDVGCDASSNGNEV
jgi:hypothetical protein